MLLIIVFMDNAFYVFSTLVAFKFEFRSKLRNGEGKKKICARVISENWKCIILRMLNVNVVDGLGLIIIFIGEKMKVSPREK